MSKLSAVHITLAYHIEEILIHYHLSRGKLSLQINNQAEMTYNLTFQPEDACADPGFFLVLSLFY